MSPLTRPVRPKLIIPDSKSVDGFCKGAASAAGSGCLTPSFPRNSSYTPLLPSSESLVHSVGNYLLLEATERNVYKAVHVGTAEECVCKVLPLSSYRSRLAAYFRTDGQCNVQSIKEIILAKTSAYVIFARHYGDLHSYVKASRRLREGEAQSLFSQIVSAVEYCHANGVIVRDLKLRKFVFADPDRKHLLLEGLEHSHVVEDGGNDTLTGTQGCPGYICPEMLETSSFLQCTPPSSFTPAERWWPLQPIPTAELPAAGYSGSAADVWSLGVMLYGMLTGRYPFQEPDAARQFEKIRSCSFAIPATVSPAARCLVKNLLRHDPALRPSVADIACHPWLVNFDADGFGSRPGSASSTAGPVCEGDQRVPDFDSSQEKADTDLPEFSGRIFGSSLSAVLSG